MTVNPPWPFRAQLLRNHDGDSFFVLADLGFSVRAEVELRLLDVFAPEIHPIQPGGAETLAFVQGWLSVPSTLLWPLHLEVSATGTGEPGMEQTFSRYVATVYRPGDAVSLNDATNAFLAQHPDWGRGD